MPKFFHNLRRILHRNSPNENVPPLDADWLIDQLEKEITKTVAVGADLRDILAYIKAIEHDPNTEIPPAASYIPTRLTHPDIDEPFGTVHKVLEMINELRSNSQKENIEP